MKKDNFFKRLVKSFSAVEPVSPEGQEGNAAQAPGNLGTGSSNGAPVGTYGISNSGGEVLGADFGSMRGQYRHGGAYRPANKSPLKFSASFRRRPKSHRHPLRQNSDTGCPSFGFYSRVALVVASSALVIIEAISFSYRSLVPMVPAKNSRSVIDGKFFSPK